MTSSDILDCSGRPLDLSGPAVMGILNVTPDSFSDGGRFDRLDEALRQAERMVSEGAAILDIGGESTRPGAKPVGIQEELDRVVPVIEKLHSNFDLPISIDTSKPEVMQTAVEAGAGLINDVNALQAEGAVEVAAKAGVPVCLMHMQGEPRTMQAEPTYSDVVTDIYDFLSQRISICEAAGINSDKIIVDPGFGFGKTLQHNLELMAGLRRFTTLGRGLLVGISRKSMIGALLGDAPVSKRLNGSLAAAVMAVERGAAIMRVHDVKETVEALKVASAVVAVEKQKG